MMAFLAAMTLKSGTWTPQLQTQYSGHFMAINDNPFQSPLSAEPWLPSRMLT